MPTLTGRYRNALKTNRDQIWAKLYVCRGCERKCPVGAIHCFGDEGHRITDMNYVSTDQATDYYPLNEKGLCKVALKCLRTFL